MDEKKRKYAKFLIQRCLSMKAGEPLLISYLTEQQDFVKIVIEEAKKLGITDIYHVCYDGKKTKDILMNSSLDEIEKEPYFNRRIIKDVYDKGGSLLSLTSYSYPMLNEVPSDKKKMMSKVKIETQEDAVKARGIYKFPWCIAAVATKQWADKLNLSSEDELWNLIFKMTLVDQEDVIKAWDDKIKNNTQKRDLLNKLKLVKLKYKSKNGTDLEIGLPKNVIWWGAAKKSFDKTKDLIVNMPTEEVFTTPDRTRVNGIVCSSRPLPIKGKIIDEFKLTFKDGKVEEASASNDNDTLLELIKDIDGMDHLGECAFVDYDSPISNINMIFNSILIDENASCHLALGKGFPGCIPNGELMGDHELLKNGINQSKNHVDFMVGTPDLNITGTDLYGNEVPLFIDGNFATLKVKEFLENRKEK